MGLGAVEATLKKIQAAKEINLFTQKGQALVTTNGELKTSQVVNAVDGLSEEG